MKKTAVILTSLLVLSGCAGGESSSASESTVRSITTTTAAETSAPEDAEKNVNFKAKFISYIDEELTYEYEGERKTVRAPLELLGEMPAITEPNCFKILRHLIGTGSEINVGLYFEYGALRFVDICTPNKVVNTDNRAFPEYKKLMNAKIEDAEMHLERHGSKVTLTGNYGSAEGDINDLADREKGNIPEEADRITFTGIQFPDGYMILTSIGHFDHEEEGKYGKEIGYISYSAGDDLMFCGTVQSLADDRATVLLNDGITVCDVPTYYNDGELSEGQQVLVTLEAESSLYGSGEQYKADYAVFITHLEQYGGEEYDFSKLAYAQPSKQRADTTVLTFADGTTKGFTYTLPTKFSFTASE